MVFLRILSSAEVGWEFGIYFVAALFVFYVIYKMSQQGKIRKAKELQDKKANIERQRLLDNKAMELESGFVFGPMAVKNIGGSGYSFEQEQSLSFGLTTESIVLFKKGNALQSVKIPFAEINELEVSGPGKVVTNAGVSGGGFGLEGFLTGAVAAAVLNSATTKSSTNTFVRVLSNTGEIYLHTSEIEPAVLKMKLSPVFVALANRVKKVASNGASVAEELEKLQKLFKDGTLSQEEFDVAKRKVLS